MKNLKSWMNDEEYETVTAKSPIPCVDLVILRGPVEDLETLLLIRKTGYEKGKWCIIGGRQYKDETVSQTIDRQAADLGVKVAVLDPFELEFPAWVNSRLNQDKTKQPVCSVYPVKIIEGEPKGEGGEYSSLKWFKISELPPMAYDHLFEVKKAVEQLKRFT